MQDLQYAFRTLRANPSFTLVAALTMALGIGVNTSLFTLVNGLLFRPTPVGDPASLYEMTAEAGDVSNFERGCSGCAEVASSSWVLPSLDDSEGQIIHGNEVSPNYFRAMQLQPFLGRFLETTDYRDLGGKAIVLNHSFWVRHFHGDPTVLGGTLKLGGRSYTIVGVAPPQFIGTMPVVAKFWTLLPQTPQSGRMRLLVRAKPGVSAARLEDELTTLRRELHPQPGNPLQDRVRLQSRAHLIPLNPATAALAGLLLAGVALVLLIACANVANLVLARSAARRREISVRLALGASRSRLLRQLLTESLVVSALGGVLALFVAAWTLPVLVVFAQSRIPQLWGEWMLDVSLDLRVFAYTSAACVAAAFLFGFAPALVATRLDVSSGLKDGGSQGIQWSRSRLRSGLVVVQVALCLVLLINAGLLVRSLATAYTEHSGFEVERNVIVQFEIGVKETRALAAPMIERLAAVPGVEAVAAGRMVPLLGNGLGNVTRRTGATGIPTGFNRVTASYFAVLGVPLVSGRTFTVEEERANAGLAVVSERAAERLFRGENPLGKTITISGSLAGRPQPPVTALVIGIVKDVRNVKLSEVDSSYVYLPLDFSSAVDTMHYFVRARADAASLLTSLRKTLPGNISGHTLTTYPFDMAIGYQRLPAQAAGALAAALGVLALLLAIVGIYGVISYAVSQRTQEIGVRIALGATSRDVTAMVVGQGMRLVVGGAVAGIAGAVPLAYLLRSFIYGVRPLDPVALVLVPLLLAVVALLAMWMPALRATRIQPVAALRHD